MGVDVETISPGDGESIYTFMTISSYSDSNQYQKICI